eukprot:g1262.t1
MGKCYRSVLPKTTTATRRACAHSTVAFDASQAGDIDRIILPPHTTIVFPQSVGGNNVEWGDKIKVGSFVQRGDNVATIVDASGADVGAVVDSPVDGFISWTSDGMAEAGMPLAVLAGDDFSCDEIRSKYTPSAFRYLCYEGTMADLLKRIKLISVFSCGSTLISMPLLGIYGDESIPLSGRLAIAFTVMSFGVGTTAAVHWLGKSYVSRMWKNSCDTYTVETYNILARRKVEHFSSADVIEADSRPFASFKVRNTERNFYLHSSLQCWTNEEREDFLFTRPDADFDE